MKVLGAVSLFILLSFSFHLSTKTPDLERSRAHPQGLDRGFEVTSGYLPCESVVERLCGGNPLKCRI